MSSLLLTHTAPPYIWILSTENELHPCSAYSMVPLAYQVQLNYYKYRTELALMIHKYILYSAYQVKTVNCRQPIQALLKYFNNYFQASLASHFIWRKIWMNKHSNYEFKSPMVEYRSVIITRRLYEFKQVFHSVPLRSHVQWVISWNPFSWVIKEE